MKIPFYFYLNISEPKVVMITNKASHFKMVVARVDLI